VVPGRGFSWNHRALMSPFFSLILPIDQFGPGGGNGRFVISDASLRGAPMPADSQGLAPFPYNALTLTENSISP